MPKNNKESALMLMNKLTFNEMINLDEQTQNLVERLMESLHHKKLDIYRINKEKQIRIGRKELASDHRAKATLALLTFSNGNVYLEAKGHKEIISEQHVKELIVLADEFFEEHPVEREGYWPYNYHENSEVSNSFSVHKNMPLNQILYGPPGTGKTYHTVEIAVRAAEPNFEWRSRDELREKYQQLVAAKRIRFVTFHQSYGYEDFVEGLTAETTEENTIKYKIKDGIFKQICHEALKSKEHIDSTENEKENYVLVIDEINRGNISKIFGELITLIEDSKRYGQKENTSLILPYSNDTFTVPDNLFIIGTMNTADRSLAMMDTALRRRFDFVEMMPEPERLKGTKVKGIDIGKLLETLNKRIEVLYDREHMLGHSFFMPVKEEMENGDEDAAFITLIGVFQNKIIPLLQEYFFEDWYKISLVLADNQRDKNLKIIEENRLDNSELSALFGNDHKIDFYSEMPTQYRLKDFKHIVWSNPEVYKSMCEVSYKHQLHVSEGDVKLVMSN
ncbi:McrB family protein [Grimontia hollisae]|nr:AAA family ATPase [Grimontia hollisae]